MKKTIECLYGRGKLIAEVDSERLVSVPVSGMHSYVPEYSQQELVKRALENPIGQPRLSELVKGKKKITIITSDHTRPVPSKVTLPLYLEEIRLGNPEAEITILVATGCHREMTREEQLEKFGAQICENEKIVVHDCDDTDNLIDIGQLPSGGRCIVNRVAVEADLLVSEGFIEPHFFAGFSGGRKSVLPGVASRKTVLANHCSEFIASDFARTGILEGNPIHRDMLWAAQAAKLTFILNVVLNSEKEVVYAVAGDLEQAHLAGCAFLKKMCCAKSKPADIVISTNGGYPLDQNVYQAVKGMTAAERIVKQGGVIIMLAQTSDGHGGEGFYHLIADEPDIQVRLAEFMARSRGETVSDQWEAQVLIRVLSRASVVYVSDAPDQLIRDLHMTPAHSVEEAIEKAEEILGRKDWNIAVIPDGISVIMEAEE